MKKTALACKLSDRATKEIGTITKIHSKLELKNHQKEKFEQKLAFYVETIPVTFVEFQALFKLLLPFTGK